ncbi:hypothetical protein OH779_00520 [Actinacidiphila glaucinigra]|uniref:hypothetical protein n=1 Tax=Actinacidiphila glaucinigra TaxID=235986 RepID=UPI0038697122
MPIDHVNGRTLYDAANAEVRFNRGTSDLIDLSDPDFAQTLAATASREQQPAPVTLRFAPEPARDPSTLDDRTALYVLAVHAQDAACRRRWLPGITDTELLTLHDFAFAARDAADHGSHYRTGPWTSPPPRRKPRASNAMPASTTCTTAPWSPPRRDLPAQASCRPRCTASCRPARCR